MSKVKPITGIRKLDPLKHPRDFRGRFVETPDAPKVTRKQTRKQAREIRDIQKGVDISRQRQEINGKRSRRESIIAAMTPEQLMRFAEVMGGQIPPSVTRGQARSQSKVLGGIQKDLNISRELQDAKRNRRLDIITAMTPEQRQRFAEVMLAKRQRDLEALAAKATVEPPVAEKPKVPDGFVRPVLKKDRKPVEKPVKEARPSKPRGSSKPKTSKTTVPLGFDDGADIVRIRPDRTGLPSWVPTNPNDLGSTRPAPKADSIAIGADGRVRVWQGKRYAKFRPGFQVSRDRNFEYGVEFKGSKLALNNNKVVYKLLGETVQGVPESLMPNLKTARPQSLFYNLARTTSFVEGGQPPSPTWQPAYNRVPDKSALYKGKYGKIEIHHIEQWAKEPLERINKEYEFGKITLKEAQERTRQIVRPSTESSSGYEIAVKPQESRQFVLLAAGSHNFTSPLYLSNHPLMKSL